MYRGRTMDMRIPRLRRSASSLFYTETLMEIEEKYNELFARFDKMRELKL